MDPVPPEVVSVRAAASIYPVANVRVMLLDPVWIVPCVSILPVALIPPLSVTPVPYSIPSSSMFPKTYRSSLAEGLLNVYPLSGAIYVSPPTTCNLESGAVVPIPKLDPSS